MATFPWVWRITPDDWCSYLSTLSIFALMEGAERTARLEAAT